MMAKEPDWREVLRERIAREPEENADPWTLKACRNLCAQLSDKSDPVDHELHESIHAVTVRRGRKSFILTATKEGWRSHPHHPQLASRDLDIAVPLARALRRILAQR